MLKWGWLTAGTLILACSALASEAAPQGAGRPRNGRTPRVNYMTECQGCHLPDGSGMAGKVPSLKGEIAKFLDVEGGRRFIIQVPGAANSKLSDEDLAEVMNWIIGTMGPRRSDQFEPYTAQEVARYRSVRLTDIAHKRELLVRQFSQPAPALESALR